MKRSTLAAARPNDAEPHTEQLLDYLAANEDPSRFHDLTPSRHRARGPPDAPRSSTPTWTRTANRFRSAGTSTSPCPGCASDWGWRDFGTKDGG